MIKAEAYQKEGFDSYTKRLSKDDSFILIIKSKKVAFWANKIIKNNRNNKSTSPLIFIH